MKWPKVEIQKVADVASGFGFPRKHQGETDGEFPFFKVGDMNLAGNEQQMLNQTNSISSTTLKKLRAKTFPAGTIVFPKIGAAIATNKKRILVKPSIVDNNVMGLIPKDNINEWYLYYWMQQFDLRRVSNIGPVPSMRKTTVEKILIPLPPLTEQQRIVEILDQADRFRKLRTEADKKAERILPAMFIKMFGDPVTNPMGWKKNPFEKLVEIGTRLVDPNREEYQSLPHIGGEHIESNTGRILPYEIVRDCKLRSNKFHFSSNHILYSKIRPYLNKVAFPQFDGLCSADIYPLIPKDDKITSWYLIALLRSQAFLDYTKVHSDRLRIPKLNKTQLGAFEAPIPDQVTLMKFEKQAKEISTLANSWDLRGTGIEKVFSVMLHRAFTGDLTASWREAHMKELLQEMELQAKALAL